MLRRGGPGEVDEIIPAAAPVLAPDQGAADLLGGRVIIFVAGRVIGVEEEVAHGRGARRLDPDHARLRLDLAPAPRHVGQVGPDVAAVGRDLLDHEGGGALHRPLDLGAALRDSRSGETGEEEQSGEQSRHHSNNPFLRAQAKNSSCQPSTVFPFARRRPKPWPPSANKWVSTGTFLRQQGGPEQQRILDHDGRIVLGVEEEGGRSVGRHVEVRRMRALALRRGVLADQVPARAGMGGRKGHRHDRIDGRREVGPGGIGGRRSRPACTPSMSNRVMRSAQRWPPAEKPIAQIRVEIEAVERGAVADQAHRPLGVGERRVRPGGPAFVREGGRRGRRR